MNKIKKGDTVDYHSVIGSEITSTGHTVLELYPMPNNFGRDCASLSGKRGVVAVAALTHSPASVGVAGNTTLADVVRVLKRIDEAAKAGKDAKE